MFFYKSFIMNNKILSPSEQVSSKIIFFYIPFQIEVILLIYLGTPTSLHILKAIFIYFQNR